MKVKRRIKSMIIVLATGLTMNAMAANYAAVDKDSCSKMVNSMEPFILILKNGDNLHEGINKCATDANLTGAAIHGLGQLSDPILAHYSNDPHEKPHFTQFNGIYELISLNGNIARRGNEYYTHLHAVLGNEKFEGLAGHIKDTLVGVTAEITIVPFSKPLERDVDPETGFGPIITE
ncbi:MAG: DNA-binding protein [Legionellaceae bacterium]|nr:DNA-binding protein [Legionellaceae bacterium]